MSVKKIKAETRTEFGKGAARRIRRDNQIPAVIYGHGKETAHVKLPTHATTMALRNLGSNALLDLEIDGTSQLALTKAVQIDSLRRLIEHIDFVAVRKGEKVTVEVQIHLTGEAARETLVVVDSTSILVEAEATNIPEWLEISLEGLEAGTLILAGQVELPEGTVLLDEDDLLIVNISEAPTTEEIDAELEEAEAAAGIEKDDTEVPEVGEKTDEDDSDK